MKACVLCYIIKLSYFFFLSSSIVSGRKFYILIVDSSNDKLIYFLIVLNFRNLKMLKHVSFSQKRGSIFKNYPAKYKGLVHLTKKLFILNSYNFVKNRKRKISRVSSCLHSTEFISFKEVSTSF